MIASPNGFQPERPTMWPLFRNAISNTVLTGPRVLLRPPVSRDAHIGRTEFYLRPSIPNGVRVRAVEVVEESERSWRFQAARLNNPDCHHTNQNQKRESDGFPLHVIPPCGKGIVRPGREKTLACQ